MKVICPWEHSRAFRRCGWSFPEDGRAGTASHPCPNWPVERMVPSQAPPCIPTVSLGKWFSAHCPADGQRMQRATAAPACDSAAWELHSLAPAGPRAGFPPRPPPPLPYPPQLQHPASSGWGAQGKPCGSEEPLVSGRAQGARPVQTSSREEANGQNALLCRCLAPFGAEVGLPGRMESSGRKVGQEMGPWQAARETPAPGEPQVRPSQHAPLLSRPSPCRAPALPQGRER